MPRPVRHWLEFAALWALGPCLAIFQVLTKSPDYLIAIHTGFPDLILVTLALVVIPPTVAAAVVWVAYRIEERAGDWAHLGMLALFVAIFAIQVLKDEFDPRRRSLGFLAIVIGLAFVYLYTRGQFLPNVLQVLSIAVPVLLIWFLALSKVAPLTLGESGPDVKQAKANGTPVVLVVFDEFSGLSLMDRRGRINPRYPNFARLSRDGTWYRDATTVADQTTQAVPAILSGQLKRKSLPSVGDHPRNVFSLLRGQYRMHVHESITHLCAFCDQESWTSRAGSLKTSVWDLVKAKVKPGGDPSEVVDLPLEALEHRDRTWASWQNKVRGGNTLNVLHIEIPHEPWWYRANGTQYASEFGIPGLVQETWVAPQKTVSAYYRRYLDQVGYADTLLGQLRRRLGSTWDKALVVVVADHGVAFESGKSRRVVSKDNLAEIASVPLFVKTPGQKRGGPSDEMARTVDIVPTIGDWLGTGWKAQGQSLRHPVRRSGVAVSSVAGYTIRAGNKEFAYRRALALKRLAAEAR